MKLLAIRTNIQPLSIDTRNETEKKLVNSLLRLTEVQTEVCQRVSQCYLFSL